LSKIKPENFTFNYCDWSSNQSNTGAGFTVQSLQKCTQTVLDSENLNTFVSADV